MIENYVDEAGKLVAWRQGDFLFRMDNSLVGEIHNDSDVIDPTTNETVLIIFHECLFTGPNTPAIAFLEPSEFVQ